MEGHQKLLRGRGVLKVKILKAKYEAKLEFPEETEGVKQKTFHGGGGGGGINIIWNCTFILKEGFTF